MHVRAWYVLLILIYLLLCFNCLYLSKIKWWWWCIVVKSLNPPLLFLLQCRRFHMTGRTKAFIIRSFVVVLTDYLPAVLDNSTLLIITVRWIVAIIAAAAAGADRERGRERLAIVRCWREAASFVRARATSVDDCTRWHTQAALGSRSYTRYSVVITERSHGDKQGRRRVSD